MLSAESEKFSTHCACSVFTLKIFYYHLQVWPRSGVHVPESKQCRALLLGSLLSPVSGSRFWAGLLWVHLLLLATFPQLSPVDRPGWAGSGKEVLSAPPPPWHFPEGVLLVLMESHWQLLVDWVTVPTWFISCLLQRIAFIWERQILVNPKRASFYLGYPDALGSHLTNKLCKKPLEIFFLQNM